MLSVKRKGLEGRNGARDGAIDRALAVLGAIAEADSSIGVSEIARHLSLPKSVVHYHVTALARNRYVEARTDRRYVLGPAALRLGGGREAPPPAPEIRSLALTHLRRLQEETSETVTLARLVGRRSVFVDQLVSPQELKVAVELERPLGLHAGASGRAILAHLPSGAREAVLAGPLEPVTPRTPVDPDWLRAELERVRQHGVATSRGEDQAGAASLAAPVFARQGVVGALGVCGPAYRFIDAAQERFKPQLRAAAAALSRDLGWRG
jgi:DNA-binding IclR family transcriptional regulator